MKHTALTLMAIGSIGLAAAFRHGTECSVCTASLIVPHRASGSTTNLKGALQYSLVDASSKKNVRLSDFKGKYKAIYIDAFASWCGPCQGAIPEVQKLHQALGKKGVLVLGLDVGDQWAAMQQNIKQQRMTYRVLHDPAERGGIGPLLGFSAIPTVIILDGKDLTEKKCWTGASPAFHAEQLKVLASLGVAEK